MDTELPPWKTVCDDRNSWRAWKRVIQHAGKRRSFDLLEPKLRQLATKIRNDQHSAGDKKHSIRPTDRRDAILSAFDEIREDRDLINARSIAADPAAYTNGVSGLTSRILLASVHLVEAMCADRAFEQNVMGCLLIIAASLDGEFVNGVGSELNARPTI